MTDDYYSEMLEVIKKVGNAAAEYWIDLGNMFFFGGIDMTFMKFVSKTLVVAKHNLLARFLLAGWFFLFSRTIGFLKSAGTDLG